MKRHSQRIVSIRIYADPAATCSVKVNILVGCISRTDSGGGETVHDFRDEAVYYPAFSEGEYPGFVPGVWMEVV